MQNKSYYQLGPVAGGLGISGSVTATRPFRRWNIFPFVYGLVALGVIALVFAWATSRGSLPLASALPDTVSWYGRITIPRATAWWSRIIFWQDPLEKSSDALKLVSSLDLVHWHGKTFAGDILPMLSGSIEIAELSSGETVLAAGLSNTTTWYALFEGVSQDPEAIHTEEIFLEGVWQSIAPQHSSFAWQIRGQKLYIASSAFVLEELGEPGPDTVLRALQDAESKGTTGVWYVRTPEGSLSRNPYSKTLLEGARFPLVLDIDVSPGKIKFSAPKSADNKLSSVDASVLQNLYSSLDSSMVLYTSSIGQQYKDWRSLFSEDAQLNLANTEALLMDLYGVDSALFSESLKDSELVFLMSDPKEQVQDAESDWVAVFSSAPEDVLKRVAETLFAIGHPLDVPVELADGSVMVELRADTEGIIWEDMFVPYNGAELVFASLQGAGEVHGYAVGTIPGIGIVLTNNISLIHRIVLAQSHAERASDMPSCGPTTPRTAGFRISRGVVRDLLPLIPSIQQIILSDDATGGVIGCVVLQLSSSQQ